TAPKVVSLWRCVDRFRDHPNGHLCFSPGKGGGAIGDGAMDGAVRGLSYLFLVPCISYSPPCMWSDPLLLSQFEEREKRNQGHSPLIRVHSSPISTFIPLPFGLGGGNNSTRRSVP